MAKITHKGSWIKIKSLNQEDKKNYLISMSLFLIGAIFWGVHLTTVDGIFGPAIEEDNTSIMTLIRILILAFWFVAAVFHRKFLLKQDELMHRYYLYLGAWGSLGFVSFGMLFSIFSSYMDFRIGFYECFLAWAIGTGIGGYVFDKKYLRDGK